MTPNYRCIAGKGVKGKSAVSVAHELIRARLLKGCGNGNERTVCQNTESDRVNMQFQAGFEIFKRNLEIKLKLRTF